MSERALMRQIWADLSRTGRVTLWRNNTGVDVDRGVRYGVGAGGADLVGFVRGSGRFFALEVKTPTGRVSGDQRLWIGHVNDHGGYAAVVRSVEDARLALEDACRSR